MPISRQYKIIISLGSHCKPAWHIRNHFKFERAMPFDWWIIRAEDAANMIRSGFEDLVRKEDVEIFFYNPSGTAFNHRKKLYHHHDFRRDENHRIIEDIDDQIEGVNQKFAFLGKRFDDACLSGGPILFIHDEYKAASHEEPITAKKSARAASDLIHALQEKYPALQCDLLYLVGGKEVPPDIQIGNSTVHFDIINEVENDEWQGAAYAALFARHNISCEQPEGQGAHHADMMDNTAWR